MKAISIFEQLAKNVFFNKKNKELINKLPTKIRKAFLNNNQDNLKKQLSQAKDYANESYVIQIQHDRYL